MTREFLEVDDTIPDFMNQDEFDEWIENHAELEHEVLLEDSDPNPDENDVLPDGALVSKSEDEIRQSVEFSGYINYHQQDFVDHYHDFIRYGHVDPPEETFTIPKDDPFSAMSDAAHYVLQVSVESETLRRAREDERIEVIG